MKLSQFNVVHEHNGSLLIMNARTGGILSLNPEYAQKFKRIQEGCSYSFVNRRGYSR